MRISDWSSDVCSSDLDGRLADARIADIERIVLRAAAEDLDGALHLLAATDQRIDLSVAGLLVQIHAELLERAFALLLRLRLHLLFLLGRALRLARFRSEEHTSELQSLMRISYAVFCLKQKNTYNYY